MNTAFILQGALFIISAFLLVPVIKAATGWRIPSLILILAVLHGTGVILVGFFQESAAALTNGVIVAHAIGAATTIVAGNALAVATGLAGRRWGTPTWYRIFSIMLGIAGIAAFLLLMFNRPLYETAGGVPERVAVYTIVAWEAATGIILLARSRASASQTFERSDS